MGDQPTGSPSSRLKIVGLKGLPKMVYNISLREWSVNLRVMLHSHMTADDVASFVQELVANGLDCGEDVQVVSATEKTGFESLP